MHTINQVEKPVAAVDCCTATAGMIAVDATTHLNDVTVVAVGAMTPKDFKNGMNTWIPAPIRITIAATVTKASQSNGVELPLTVATRVCARTASHDPFSSSKSINI